jgi:integrase/recombinase XerD
MPRLGQRIKTRKPAPVKPAGVAAKDTVDPLAHNPLTRYLEQHFEWMLVTGYSKDTVRTRRQALRRFIAWADERGISDPKTVTRPMLERYQRHLFYYRKSDGRPLSLGMQGQYLAPLKTWFTWLVREHHVLANPASDLQLPKQPKNLPRSLLTVQEVEAILN